jgi:DNA-binding LacI/PurR family transcriptional regulator
MGALPTVDDVARAAGVSRQTVSNVVNSPGIVRPATREKVEDAIVRLGYRPHASARRLRTQTSATIGMRLDSARNGISGAVLDRFLHSLTELADARDMRVLLFTARDPLHELEQIRRLHEAADADAFLLTSTFHDDPRTEALISLGIPFVTFGRPWGIDDMNDPQHLWVDIDGRRGVHDATVHLLDRGAEQVLWLGWPAGSGTGDDRRRGWEEAMASRTGRSPAELDSWRLETEDVVGQARDAVAALLETGRPTRPDADGGRSGTGPARAIGFPDAIVCASDSLALGARIAASAAGRPGLPIVGFDNTPVAEAVGFSSVQQQLGEVAAGALELLLGSSGSKVISRGIVPGEAHRLIRPSLVVRDGDIVPHPSPDISTSTSTSTETADPPSAHRKESK